MDPDPIFIDKKKLWTVNMFANILDLQVQIRIKAPKKCESNQIVIDPQHTGLYLIHGGLEVGDLEGVVLFAVDSKILATHTLLSNFYFRAEICVL